MLATMLRKGIYNSVAAPGQVVFSSLSTISYEFIVPNGVTSICAVVIGRGGLGGNSSNRNCGGGGGGGLSYSNDIPVTPGETLTCAFSGTALQTARLLRGADILVSAQNGGNGATSTSTASAGAGGDRASGVGAFRASGGVGGVGASSTHPDAASAYRSGGGGGCAGYSTADAVSGGRGGAGAPANTTAERGGAGNVTSSGRGAAGGGATHKGGEVDTYQASAGGGVGVLGHPFGSSYWSGLGGLNGTDAENMVTGGEAGFFGSDGGVGFNRLNGGVGGAYGGGGGGGANTEGGAAAIRIIWGEGRSFPYEAGNV
jgi:hypothetical protein